MSANGPNRPNWTGASLRIIRVMNPESVDLTSGFLSFKSKANYSAQTGREAAKTATSVVSTANNRT